MHNVRQTDYRSSENPQICESEKVQNFASYNQKKQWGHEQYIHKSVMLYASMMSVFLFNASSLYVYFIYLRKLCGLHMTYCQADGCVKYHTGYERNQSVFNYTHQHVHIYVLFKKSKIYIKTLKTLQHVSIIWSSSGSILCSLLKLQFKTFSELLFYVNLVMWQHVMFLCVSHTVFRMSLVMVVRHMLCSVRLTLHGIWQSMLPEDDHMIETCRSVLSVLM